MATAIFLSHASADIELARKVQAYAKPFAVETYVYEDDATPGAPLARKLEDRIRDSDAVLVLLTKNSRHKPSVHAEIGVARGLGKFIIPVIEVGLDPMEFAVLQGLEYIPLDPDRLDEALLVVQKMFKRMVEAAREHAVLTVLLVAIAAIALYWVAKAGRHGTTT